ncbi:MAG: class B sortase [Ruminococcus sp.]|nr:class B sortase [Ruminococcus sp.]MDE6849250.1 class B sortase [Ruminococcus sp.]MDE7137519.1 class B sortase [Ruminococcus sp.]
MNPIKVISVLSAFVAVASISVAMLMMSEKEGNTVPVVTMSEEATVTETESTTKITSLSTTTAMVVTEPTVTTTLPVYDYIPNNKGMTDFSKLLRKQNKDFVGWLKIKNTMVNYPVMKDPGEIQPDTGYGTEYCPPNEFYLHHDFDKNYLFEGTLYMDYRDVFGNDENTQSDNIVIYGHNMLNDSMFGSLDHYYQIDGFYNSSQFIELSSNYKDYNYVIFGYIITSGDAGVEFDYWNREEFEKKEDFDWYVGKIREKQMLDTGVDVKYGDKLLTLSTCYSDADNSRFIIVARRLRDGEVEGDFSTIQKIKPEEPSTAEVQTEENQFEENHENEIQDIPT